jgi:hypothetical protein
MYEVFNTLWVDQLSYESHVGVICNLQFVARLEGDWAAFGSTVFGLRAGHTVSLHVLHVLVQGK